MEANLFEFEAVANSVDPKTLACLSLISQEVTCDHFLKREELSFSRSLLDQALRIQEQCDSRGARILFPGHREYPSEFFRLEQPPLFLACQGEAVWLTKPGLAVVGSRNPSGRALDWMDLHLAHFLRGMDAFIVSGGARGIDQRAHAVAIRAKKPTVVFLPSGLNRPFPPEIREWEKEILDGGGAILSPYALEQEVRRFHFEGRNRLIAALGVMSFVVEARRKSGSLMTARLAREVHRSVCVLPAFPGEIKSAGTVDLLFDGALPIRDSEDLRALFHLHVLQFTSRLA